MSDYRVVIPCAGIGSRLGSYSKKMNKALVTLGNLPAIVHIVNKFGPSVEIVVILGYKGDQVRQVLKAFFPNRQFIFVEADKFEGPGSGLGYSLLCAKSELQMPFIFCSNDTVIPNEHIDIDPNEFGNWMGHFTGDFDYSQYRTVELSEDCSSVEKINPKGSESKNAYIGLCGIRDYEDFWEAMSDPTAVDAGEAFGLKVLKEVHAVSVLGWCDTGNLKSLDRSKKELSDPSYNILEKEDEAIWFSGGRVYKFSVDENFIADRVKRLAYVGKKLFPKIVFSDRNLYVYEKVPGDVLGESITPRLVTELLTEADDSLWSVRAFDKGPATDRVLSFYKDKTIARVKKFLAEHEMADREVVINGWWCLPVMTVLDEIQWDAVVGKAVISRYHGDFHNENIIWDGESFKFLDWRQNFGDSSELEFGDAYYDLAKFYHGLIVSHKEVAAGNYSVRHAKDGIRIDITRRMTLVEGERAFFDWVGEHGWDADHIRLLTALIFLNIAPLHEREYGLFLFYLGRYLLTVL